MKPSVEPYLPLPWGYEDEGEDGLGGRWGNIFAANGKVVAEAIYEKDARAMLWALNAARDALRWQALMACSRSRVLGYARGGPQGRDGPIRHIGFEFTSDQAPYCDLELKDAHEHLIAFTDALLNAAPQATGDLTSKAQAGKATNPMEQPAVAARGDERG